MCVNGYFGMTTSISEEIYAFVFFVILSFLFYKCNFRLEIKKIWKKGITRLAFDLKENPIGYWICVSFGIGMALFSLIVFFLLL